MFGLARLFAEKLCFPLVGKEVLRLCRRPHGNEGGGIAAKLFKHISEKHSFSANRAAQPPKEVS
jgi:hypothetical protein